jgi:hypothetical protein
MLKFPSKKPVPKHTLESVIDYALSELSGHDASSEEYAQIVDQLTKLNAIHDAKPKDRLSKDTLAMVIGNLVGIIVIVGHERAHVITSKAVGFVGKLANLH